ncbi:SDR family oxidoreductase [Paenibacillus sp.]|uniref:SDR family oxidoreductase n=1 Tax=Paenibacillus sp. TaxID=58172 RepID=UPI002D4DA329|nr:SDR family oxidoreductase [Paenibacillus sp.]HZG86386.1 SDR family oxidoreductase [Paenibacillus sp.]
MEQRRTALIIGASGGIGLAAALELAGRGVRVAIAARAGERLERAASVLRDAQPEGLAFAADVADADDRRILFERVDAELGRLDILVNSVPGAEPASFLEHGIHHIEEGIRKKLLPYLDAMKLASDRMRTRRWGRIVNVVGNMWKEPDPLRYNFGIVNAAIVNASKAAAFELAPYGITVNGVHPGSILTDRLRSVWADAAERRGVTVETVAQGAAAGVPAGRVGTPEEAAAVIAFLASEEAGYVTGQQISVDGGSMRSM